MRNIYFALPLLFLGACSRDDNAAIPAQVPDNTALHSDGGNCGTSPFLAVGTSGTYQFREQDGAILQIRVDVTGRNAGNYNLLIETSDGTRSGTYDRSGNCPEQDLPADYLELSEQEAAIVDAYYESWGLPANDLPPTDPPPSEPAPDPNPPQASCVDVQYTVDASTFNATRCTYQITRTIDGVTSSYTGEMTRDKNQEGPGGTDTPDVIVAGILSRRITRNSDGAVLAEMWLTEFQK